MDYKIEAKPFVHKSGQKYLTLEITDMAFHSSNPRETVKIGKKMEEAIAEKRAGRFYTPLSGPPPTDRESIKKHVIERLQNNEDFVRLVRDQEEQGVRSGNLSLHTREARCFVAGSTGNWQEPYRSVAGPSCHTQRLYGLLSFDLRHGSRFPP